VSRRRAKKHASSGSRRWIVRFLLITLIGLGIWWSLTGLSAIRRNIKPLPSGNHNFMVTQVHNPTILLINEDINQRIESLAVGRFDYANHSITILKLPPNLSDGQTSANEYLSSGYFKELQQMVEQTLALPIDDYIIQPPVPTTDLRQVPWLNILSQKPKPGWWQTTIGAPWWLSMQPGVQTDLSAWQFTQLVWLARDADASRVNVQTVSSDMFTEADGQLVANTDKLDDLVSNTLADQNALKQQTSVVVKNATQVSGLATLVARYAKHLGGEVVAVDAADSGQTTTSIKAAKGSAFTDALSSFLAVPLTVTPPTGRERADVELVVGVDAINRLGKPSQ
jgi:hypothetical protein